jgi:F0F1-type ATP synthase assembly protein I
MVRSLLQVQNHLWRSHYRVNLLMTERKPPKSRDDLDERLSQFRNERDVATGRTRNDGNRRITGSDLQCVSGLKWSQHWLSGLGSAFFLMTGWRRKPWFMLTFFLIGSGGGNV